MPDRLAALVGMSVPRATMHPSADVVEECGGVPGMASPASLEHRIRALEARLAEVEGGYGDSLYKIRRDCVATRIDVGRLLDQAGLPRAGDTAIDAVLDDDGVDRADVIGETWPAVPLGV